MHVQFDSTFDEAVDEHLRLLKRVKAAQAWYWQGVIATGVGTGVFLFLTLPSLPGSSLSLAERWVWSVAGVVLGAVVFSLWHPRSIRGRIRRVLREQRRGDGPFRIEIDLNESGISAKQENGQICLEWPIVEEIEETPDSIDFYARGTIIVVRKRAFASEAELQQFGEVARQYLARAKA